MSYWDVALVLSQSPTDDEMRARLLMELIEPLDVVVSIDEKSGKTLVGMMLEGDDFAAVSEQAARLVRAAAVSIGQDPGVVTIPHAVA